MIYNIYSYATGKSITFEELVEGSHYDALNTFIDNNSNSLFDKTNYDNLILGVGGDSVARWIFNAYLGHDKGQIVEPSKYQDYLSLLYNGYKDEAGIPKIVPPRELHFILLNTNIQHTLDTFKFERDSGNENMAKGIIYALEGLNPLALENPSQNISILYNFIEPQNYSDEWILARSWMLLESLSIASTNRQDGAFAQFFNHFDIVRAKEHLQYSIKNARSLFNVEDDAKIIFDSGSYSFETSNSGTEYRIVFKTNNQVVEGSNSSDWLFGSLDNDVFHADAGNDKIFAEDGDDEITGGSGRNLLNGGKGRDFYHFNTADGDFDDTIIDSDGKGQLIIDGESLLGHFFDPKAGVINAWTAKIGNYDWQAVLTDNGDLILNTLQGNHRITIPGWKAMGNNGLEIILREYNSTIDPSVNMTLLGDWRTKILDETYTPPVDKKYYGQYDWNHWYTRNPNGAIDAPYGVAEKDFDDVIDGVKTKKNDLKIYGFGGDDALGGSEGNDYIYGGEGRDLIAGSGGKDMVDAGAGDDFIFSNYRLSVINRLRPDERWKMPDNGIEEVFAGRGWGVYSTADESWRVSGIYQQTNDTGVEGDQLFGGSGSDWIFGSNLDDFIYGDRNSDRGLPEMSLQGDDKIYGLGGEDIIEGNGGNDIIWGDGLTKIGVIEYENPKNHGRDTLAGGYGSDTIYGGGNNDTIYGGDGDDYLYGDQWLGNYSSSQLDYFPQEFQGIDEIFGGSGDDKIVGGGNNDLLHGGKGNDHIWGDYGNNAADKQNHGSDTIWGDEGHDYISGGYSIDTLHGGSGNDSLIGGAGGDIINGDSGNDTISGDETSTNILDFVDNGVDLIHGGDGDDVVIGGGMKDYIYGDDGNDILYGDEQADPSNNLNNPDYYGDDEIYGGDGDDWLLGGYGMDRLFGGTGTDRISGGGHTDFLYGGDGDDFIWGDSHEARFHDHNNLDGIDDELKADDHLFGGSGNDYLDGNLGDDHLYGEEGDDSLIGGSGNDYLMGVAGNDKLGGDRGNDYIYGEDGDDILYAHGIDKIQDTDPPELDAENYLYGGSGMDRLYGGFGNDELHGDEDNDYLHSGKGGNDRLYGGSGNDHLFSINGKNELYGDEGNDVLQGGTGEDLLNGGIGNDTYRYKREFGHDIIDNTDRIKDRFDIIHFMNTQRNEIEILRENDDLIIRTLDGDNQITVLKHFSQEEPWHFINGIRFADGSWLARENFFPHEPPHNHNHAPEVVQPLDNLAVKAGSEVSGKITLGAISDPDGETLAYQLTMTDGIPLPDWLKFDAQTGAFSGQAPTDSSLLNLRLTGTDHAGASAFADFTLQVNAAPKVSHPLDNHREVEDRDFSFQLPQDTFTDPKSDPLNLQLVQGNGEALPGWLHFDAASGTVSGHAPVGSPDLSLSLIATDPLGNQSHADFSLALTEPPQTVKSSWHGGTIYGKDGDDHLIGSNFNDRIHGGDGNDYLKAKFGNDVLDGGKGNDRLLGDWGNDEYFYRAGDGHDTIQDSQGKDTLILDGIRHSDTRFLLRGKDLVLEFTQDGGSIVIENHAGSGRMEHFRFADLHLDHRAVEDLMRRLGDNHGVI